MRPTWRNLITVSACAVAVLLAVLAAAGRDGRRQPMEARGARAALNSGQVTVRWAIAHDVSPRLAPFGDAPVHVPTGATHVDVPATSLAPPQGRQGGPPPVPVISAPPGAGAVEQTTPGQRPPARLVVSFDGLGNGFRGPQGEAALRNPSDNSLAVGPNHIVQIVNSRMAIYSRKGEQYDSTGRVLYGPVPTNNVFRGFGGPCEARNNGDAVARYDQLAQRWLIVMPIFTRNPERTDTTPPPAGGPASRSAVGQDGQPGTPRRLFEPPPPPPESGRTGRQGREGRQGRRAGPPPTGTYSMCYALSVDGNPFGPYYRYEFVRPLFPDYPRPAVWPDGYYLPTSTGDNVIQKHACVVDRVRMLRGAPATEQCVVIDGVNFLNIADLDGTRVPPRGAPEIMMAAGGTQLHHVFEDSVVLTWTFHVDWDDARRTRVEGPVRIPVAPYHYLCDGQLSNCVPQPGTDRRLDAQGDKIMARLVYRRLGDHESIVAVHSVNTIAGAGGVRWYEFRLGARRAVTLFQQGTFAPDSAFRWMASPAIDRNGGVGIGYSYGGPTTFAGQRFAARLPDDPKGQLSLRETVLAEGEGAQTNTLRWEDYTQTAIDPRDDCTIWYVGDYFRQNAETYSTRIGAFRLPGCEGAPADRGGSIRR